MLVKIKKIIFLPFITYNICVNSLNLKTRLNNNIIYVPTFTKGDVMLQFLFYEEVKGSLPSFKDLDLKETDCEKVCDFETAKKIITEDDSIRIFVTDTPSWELLHLAKQHHDILTILVTSLPILQYSTLLKGEEDVLLNHVIASYISSEWTTQFLKITINKIVNNDIFGLEKYLNEDAIINKTVVKGSMDRLKHNEEIAQFASNCHLGSYISKLIIGISEELLMNAIYDAPIKDGTPLYNHLPRTTEITLQPYEYPTLSYGYDGIFFGVSILDPFGTISKQVFFEHIKKSINRSSESLLSDKIGGAGLGILKILHSCHCLICNVETTKQSEFIALINTKSLPRDLSKATRSVHFFEKGF